MKMADPGWSEQRDKVDELNSEIKALEQSYGVYSRDVGNYGKAAAELRGELEDLLKTLKSGQSWSSSLPNLNRSTGRHGWTR